MKRVWGWIIQSRIINLSNHNYKNLKVTIYHSTNDQSLKMSSYRTNSNNYPIGYKLSINLFKMPPIPYLEKTIEYLLIFLYLQGVIAIILKVLKPI